MLVWICIQPLCVNTMHVSISMMLPPPALTLGENVRFLPHLASRKHSLVANLCGTSHEFPLKNGFLFFSPHSVIKTRLVEFRLSRSPVSQSLKSVTISLLEASLINSRH